MYVIARASVCVFNVNFQVKTKMLPKSSNHSSGLPPTSVYPTGLEERGVEH